MNAPLTHPAAWTADTLGDWQFPSGTLDPEQIRDHLEHGPGVLLLRGAPLPDPKNTARNDFRDWCATLGSLLPQNEKGDTIFDVSDAGLDKDDPRTRGPNTNRRLSFHTDRCDVIGFFCWRQARAGGENQILSSLHLYNEIAARRPDLLAVLMQPYVYKRHSVDLANPQSYIEQPIFSFCESHFACSFLRVLIDRAHSDPDLPDLNDEQIEAMDFLEAVADEPGIAIHYRQEPGDILLINNWVTLHRRSGFEDHDEPAEKRCLFRSWLSMPNSRPLDSAFAANFGDVAAGAVRGGFPVESA